MSSFASLASRKRVLIALLTLSLVGTVVALIGAGDPAPLEQKTRSANQWEKHTNRLIDEKSPYLLQHAHNPVDWYPWGDAAFEKARKENKLIFLSIGYSTCYWCHVMEREVFEKEEIAALMNEHFVSIKVDREERPDVDRIYMAALQAMTRGGGWPMSMFLTPDLNPFYGATYIPPEPFKTILTKVQEVWTAEPAKIHEAGKQLTQFLEKNAVAGGAAVALEKSILTKGFEQFRDSYDTQHAGFGKGPKFPRPSTFNFLLRYHSRFGERQALKMTLATLRRMAQGGIYDHLGGGFHRYSVDGQWRVPHFEKMLYDQSQLVSVYLDAYQITGDEFYAAVARDTLRYVLREMTDKDGGFYSAEDAESAPDPAKPKKKEEGAYYIWTGAEVDGILGKELAGPFRFAYGVQDGGNALEDPHKVFVGKNIPYVAHSLEETAARFGKTPIEMSRLLSDARERLLAEREKRARPHLDDKVLVSWNGLMISGFARAFQVLGDRQYLRAAEKAAEFIATRLYDSKGGQLLRRYRAGEARYAANLEDYAFFTAGLIDLYEAGLDIRWLKLAAELTEQQSALFLDDKNGGFFDTSSKDASLLFKTKNDHDGAEPAGNSVVAMNLLRLAQMTNNERWRAAADRTLALFADRFSAVPQALPQMLCALDFHLDKAKQVIIAGRREKDDTWRMVAKVHESYIPNKIILLADGGEGQRFLSRHIAFIESVRMLDGKATAYICENYACRLPTSDPAVTARLLSGN